MLVKYRYALYTCIRYTIVMALCCLSSGLVWSQQYDYNYFNEVEVNANHLTTSKVLEFPLESYYTSQIIKSRTGSNISTIMSQSSNSIELTLDYSPPQNFLGLDTVIVEVMVGGPPIPLAKIYYAQYVFHVLPSIIDAKHDYGLMSVNDSSLTLSVLDNDSSTKPGLCLGEVLATQGGEATLENSVLTFVPDSGFVGIAHIGYQVCDSTLQCKTSIASIHVRDNQQLSGYDTMDLVLSTHGSLHTFLPSGGYFMVSSPTLGSATVDYGIGVLHYSSTNQTGYDVFRLTNGFHNRIYRIHVIGKTSQSLVANDAYALIPGQSIMFNVLANDRARNFSVKSYTQPSHGRLEQLNNGLFAYTADSNYIGLDQFNYTLCAIKNCETATVELSVSNFEPDPHVSQHHVTGLKNHNIFINYDVPIGDYTFEVEELADNGLVSILVGDTIVESDCVQSQGRFIIIYTPDSGFTGLDGFKVSYCVNDQCYIVDVVVEVLNHSVYDTCRCLDQCVWPGDANHDGLVNEIDVLSIGQSIGLSGPNRIFAEPLWYGQIVEDWDNDLVSSDAPNCKYADSDGDGLISSEDVELVDLHLGNQHTILPSQLIYAKPYDLSLELDIDSIPSIGDTVRLYIHGGNVQQPIYDISGISLDLSFDPTTVDTQFTTIIPVEESWLSRENPMIFRDWKKNNSTTHTLALSRTNGVAQVGYGRFLAVDIIIDDDIDGLRPSGNKITIPIQLQNIRALDAMGRVVHIPDQQLYFEALIPGIDVNTEDPNQINAHPNPIRDKLHISSDIAIDQVDIHNISGQLYYTEQFNGRNQEVTLALDNLLTKGIYILSVHTKDGRDFKKKIAKL